MTNSAGRFILAPLAKPRDVNPIRNRPDTKQRRIEILAGCGAPSYEWPIQGCHLPAEPGKTQVVPVEADDEHWQSPESAHVPKILPATRSPCLRTRIRLHESDWNHGTRPRYPRTALVYAVRDHRVRGPRAYRIDS